MSALIDKLDITKDALNALYKTQGSGEQFGIADILLQMNSQKQDASGLVVLDSNASLGGAGSETLTVTGLLSTDTIMAVSQKTAGGNGLALTGFGAPGNGSLPVTWTGNPGAGAIVRVAVKR